MNLKYKLILPSIIISIFLTGIFSVISLEHERQVATRNITTDIKKFKNHNLVYFTSKIWHLDYDAISFATQQLLNYSSLDFLIIRDTRDRLLFSKSKTNSKNILQDTFQVKYQFKNAEQFIGTITIGAAKPTFWGPARQHLVNLFVINGLIVFTIFISIYFCFNHLILRHLENVTDFVKSYDPQKHINTSTRDIFSHQNPPEELIRLTSSITDTGRRIRDELSQRKLAEESLQNSESRYRIIFEHNPLGIMLMDKTGVIIDCNDIFLDLMGASREQVIGFNGVQSAPPKMREVLKQAIKGENVLYTDKYTSVTGGKSIFLRAQYSPVNPESTPSAIIATYQDISDDIKAGNERNTLLEQLQQAQKIESVGRLAGGIAHDFNNMLGVILGYSDIALEELDKNHPLYPCILEIKHAATHSAELTRQLLTFARKQPVSPKILNLDLVIDGMLLILQRLIGENIKLTLNKGSEEPWRVHIDPVQINQILANLCINSKDAMADTGSIRILTENIEITDEKPHTFSEIPAGEYVLITVSDDGKGIEQENIKVIFEPFFTTKQQGEGTGLGLATVYGIIKQNHGHIKVTSSSDAGTTFHIYLQRHDSQNQPKESPPPEPEKILPQRVKDSSILIVEDDASMLHMINTMLRELEYKITEISDPADAISVHTKKPDSFDLLITDVVMPNMSGHNLAKELRKLSPNLPCLFISGYTAAILPPQNKLTKNMFFLQKPFSKADLHYMVNKILGETKE